MLRDHLLAELGFLRTNGDQISAGRANLAGRLRQS